MALAYLFRCTVLLFACLYLPVTFSWEKAAQEDGITVYLSEQDGNDFKAFRGEAVFKSGMRNILSHLLDPASMTEWLKDCSASELVQRINQNEVLVYQRSDAPWPISDRDYVYHSRLEQDPDTLVVTIRFEATAHPPSENEECVRVTRLEGHWRLTPSDINETLVEYQTNADPGGVIPAWLANQFVVSQPMDTLKNLRARLESKQSGVQLPAGLVRMPSTK